ncbi:MAG: preprotein translocase subunit SecY [Actinobacteria bacterium]|nr:preprotein translocase subunit SecY [Actinomycetota bacterium]
MLTSMKNMFKVADLRGKILFTLFMLFLYRLGAHIPVPGINVNALKDLQKQAQQGGVLQYLQLFSGGAITQFAVFALGIMPYITSSIIMQILAVVIPKLEQWQEQGAVGQRKITQWTRYLTIAIAIMQSTGLTVLFHRGGGGFNGGNPTNTDLFGGRYNAGRVLLVVVTLTAGTALIMWMGELITQRGIGNGMSILIFGSVVSRLPANFGAVKAEKGLFVMGIVVAIFSAVLVSIVFMEQGQRRIPVQFPKRVVGRRMTAGQNTYIPLKVNAAGVIPVIFASSVLYLPIILSQVLPVRNPGADGTGGNWAYSVQNFVNTNFVRGTSWVYLLIYGVLTILFTYFYVAIQFDPHKQADNIRKQGGFIPGIRPGPQTERYLGRILNRITLPGALFIAAIAVIPAFILGRLVSGTSGAQLGFFGISILIAVGVALETMKQIDSQLMMRNYEGFLKS